MNYLTDPDFEGPLQTVWSSSSIEAAKVCLKKWYYQKFRGLRKIGNTLAPHFGDAVHKARYEYNITPGTHAEKLRAAIRRGVSVFDQEIGDKDRNRKTLIRTIVLSCDRAQNIKFFETVDGPAVEFRTSVDIGNGIMLFGLLDCVPEVSNVIIPTDYKTTGKSLTNWYWNQFVRSSQVTAYLLLATMAFPKRPAGLIIEAMSVTAARTEIESRTFHRTPSYLERWRKTALRKIDEVHEIALNEDPGDAEAWPENDTACRFCDFFNICAAPDPIKPQIIKAQYKERTANGHS